VPLKARGQYTVPFTAQRWVKGVYILELRTQSDVEVVRAAVVK
jgi:hypothetical protein